VPFENYLAEWLGWHAGDFNGDAVTDGADYTIWADNYLAGGATVPAPATLLPLLAGGVALARRRRGR